MASADPSVASAEASAPKLEVGALVVLREAVQTPRGVGAGYLNAPAGASVRILYVGQPSDAEEAGWCYGRLEAGGDTGVGAGTVCGNDGSSFGNDANVAIGWMPCSACAGADVTVTPILPTSTATMESVIGASPTAVATAATADASTAASNSATVACANDGVSGTTAEGANLLRERSATLPRCLSSAVASRFPTPPPPPTRPCPGATPCKSAGSASVEQAKADRGSTHPRSPVAPPPPLALVPKTPSSFCSSLAAAAATAGRLGLELVGARAPPGTGWQYPLADADGRSFVGYLPGAVAEPKAKAMLCEIMHAMSDLEWERPVCGLGRISRGTKWMVRKGCRCPYWYGGAMVRPAVFPAWMYRLMEVFMPICGLPIAETWPNSCNINCYSDGSDALDWHADDEPMFGGWDGDCRIISLSLGAERTFEVRRAADSGDVAGASGCCGSADDGGLGSAESCRLRLRSGDLCTMEGHTQRRYVHRVPKASKTMSRVRVNITWRWVVNHHKRKCGL
eukprot:TRINITY_DN12120_c0_g1_i1.p1 TRINITY_DN12120_c0_g1~~TRINITY_DN12120_c0_g1_i1.p1  ORF type:complete len:557 (+),score=103.13 TRINITY_DN12120_c0_g1_i1:139-1671(+)